jgi:hypothetical protein
MNLKTPLMYGREFIPAAYQDKIYCGIITGKGSDTTLQDDFLANVWTPDTPSTFVHNSDKTFDCDDSAAVSLTSGAFPAIAVGEDLLLVSIFKVQALDGLSTYACGSAGTTGFANRCSMDFATGTGPIVKDGVTAVTTAAQSRADASNDPAVGDVVLVATAWDRTVGTELYFYNVTEGVEIDNTSTAQAANAGFTPTSVTRITAQDNVYCDMTFSFTSNGLPATWKADMLAMANNLVTLKA